MTTTLLTFSILLALALGIALAVLLFAFGKLKTQIGGWVQEHLRNSNEQFLQLATERLGREQVQAQTDLKQKKEQIENSMDQMKTEMEKVSRLMQGIEKDRSEKFGSLDARLRDLGSVTVKLQQSTDRFTSILANVKLRGQLGERVAEDILRACGLIEEVHYRKNKTQENSASRPDYVFCMPNDRKVCMDVKFPLDNYMAMVNSDNAEMRANYQDVFLRDVKNRAKEITRRDYISIQEQTLDFVILFIPNEQVFGFIQEAAPGLQDELMQQKVVMCSPWTLYAFVAVIREFTELLNFEQKAREMLVLIKDFQEAFGRFKTRFDTIGTQLKKVQDTYKDVTDKSFNQLDTSIRKIDEYRKGSSLLAQSQVEPIAVLPPSEP